MMDDRRIRRIKLMEIKTEREGGEAKTKDGISDQVDARQREERKKN